MADRPIHRDMDEREVGGTVARQAEAVIASITECVERGKGRGKLHVYPNGSMRCECGSGPDREKERMK